MNFLLHNPLTELPLPYFLGLYPACALIGLVVGSLWIWLCDGTRDEDLPESCVPLPNPYEIAFLSGEANRVARLVVFDLIERGYIELADVRRWFAPFAPYRVLKRREAPPSVADLTPVQRAAWNWLAQPRSPRQLLHRHIGLSKNIRSLCRIYVSPLEERRLLETAGRRTARTVVGATLVVCIVGVGLYKLITAEAAGTGQTFCLALMMVVGLLFTAIICRRQRLSDLGHRTLERLQMKYGDKNCASVATGSGLSRLTDPDGLHANADRMLAMALFGTVGLCHETDHFGESAQHTNVDHFLLTTSEGAKR